MSIEQALSDLTAATTADHLGRPHLLDGVSVVCVKKSLEQKVADVFSTEGLVAEGFRITAPSSAMPYVPRVGGEIDVAGTVYEIRQVLFIGDLVRFVVTRYSA
jgi:hypothetical protein